MTPELDKKLSEKYPDLFKSKNLPPTQSLMCFGCECGDGWYKILDDLFGYLTSHMKRKLYVKYLKEHQTPQSRVHNLAAPQIILDQVKEKYGTLRCYYHIESEDIPDEVWGKLDLTDYYKIIEGYSRVVDDAIDYAEYQTSTTCEVTGKEGKLYTRGWHRVLCDEEAVANGYCVETEGCVLEKI